MTTDPKELMPDDVTVSREVLMGVREALETLSRDDSNMVQDIAIKALASLDAVLSEGK